MINSANDRHGAIRGWCQNAADQLATGVAVVLPWSTSLTLLLIFLWLAATLVALRAAEVKRELLTVTGAIPVALFCLATLSTCWADIDWAERLGGVDGLFKLLAIPLLFAQFHRSQRGRWIVSGYLVSCTALLALSWIMLLFFSHATLPSTTLPGVPVKDVLSQRFEFIICAFAGLFLAIEFFRSARWGMGFALLTLVFLFFADIIQISLPETWFLDWFPPFVTTLVLFFLLVKRSFGIKAIAGVVVAAAITGIAFWIFSSDAQYLAATLSQNVIHNPADLLGNERAEFWPKSLSLIRQAPLLGHGAGSIHVLFARASGQPYVPTDPLQQTLSIGIQLGVVGVVLLWSMWLSHLLIFRGNSLLDWTALVVIIQNIIMSFSTSPLTGFSQGWTYVLFVGAIGGTTARLGKAINELPAELKAAHKNAGS